MKRHMDASEAVRIKYDSKYAQSANYWKNSIGMNKCIDSIGIIQNKAAYEQKIASYVDSTGFLKGRLSFPLLQKAYNNRYQYVHDYMEYRENLRQCLPIQRALKALSMVSDKLKDGNEKSVTISLPVDTAEWDLATEKEIMVAMLRNYREKILDHDLLPDLYQTIDGDFKGDYTAYVNQLFDKSALMKEGQNEALSTEVSNRIENQERYLCAAKLRMEQDMPHYSDANFTMRLSYGQVGGFMLGGKPSGYYTTAESIIDKMDRSAQQPDWKAEPIMRQLLSSDDFGPYRDKQTGKMQLCFLTNNDITGGNSGSPMFNGKGELIGLAFDGNWDSLSSDINFDRQLARCIGVDIRYVLFMMDRWGHADRLLKEINAK